ncbi:hypothetical protein C2S51_017577 [Perilla frutescens var. frutescens]|nr:hypothetical protein C2S51_017577 [Perilla frutescens var. frutescens]
MVPSDGISVNSGKETTDIVILDNEDNIEDVETTSINENESVMLQIQSDSFDVKGCLLGLKRKKIDDIYDLYCSHALENGFSVRKSTTRTENGCVVEKYFLCSCKGAKKPNTSSSRKVKVTRTCCKAYLREKINSDGLYEIIEHNLMHNHTLTRRKWSHMHRLHRSINCEKGVVIEGMLTSGIRATDSFRYMAHDAGGEDCVGHTLKDHLNYVNRLKMSIIEGGDAQTLIDEMHAQGVENKDFFFRVKLDDDGRLSNVFWRDAMMKEDYMIYGDVVVFDTTYHERIESFIWLFEVFKKSMEGKSHVSIFTDQDLAIGTAIEHSFPDTRHRLCLWHLYQNAISRFGNLKVNKSFINEFQKCLSGCTNREEFEHCWSSMISTYHLEDNSWFSRLYLLKEKWCTGLNNDFFSAGILSSQRSESINSAIGFNARKSTSLTEFYDIFKRTVQSWKRNEASDEFQCSRAQPTSFMSLTGLLKHASELNS